MAFRIPYCVPTVFWKAALHPRSIGLHAGRIHGEIYADSPISKWIQQHAHRIVEEYVFAPRQVIANQIWMTVVADKDEIDCRLRVTHPNFSFFSGWGSVFRCALNEI